MKTTFIAVTALMIASIGTAQAHTKLESSMPAGGSTVATSPTQFVLTFNKATRVTSLVVQKDGGSEQKVTSLPKDASARIAVDAPRLDAGHYTLSWRAVGDDGHIMTGKLSFSVAAQ